VELDEDPWAHFTPAEQLQHCRYMAAEAHRLSERGDGHADKIIYSGFARRWVARANEIERRHTGQTEAPIPTASLTRLWRSIRTRRSIRAREAGPE
jgi:hypothetical protein